MTMTDRGRPNEAWNVPAVGGHSRFTSYPLAIRASILSAIVLLPGRLFSGPEHAPTLKGQYVLKDVVPLSASLPSTVPEASRRTRRA